MANPPKPWKAEYAKSGRSSCKTCKNNIEKEKLRLGKLVPAKQFDGFMPMWNHAECIFKKSNQIKSLNDVEGLDSLRWEDQERLKKYVDITSSSSVASSVSVHESSIEVSQNSRAACKICKKKITKGSVRVSIKTEEQTRKSSTWHHASCFLQMSPSTQIEKFIGWSDLSDQEKESVRHKKDVLTTKHDSNVEMQEKKVTPESISKGTKRKNDARENQRSKANKSHGDYTATVSSRLTERSSSTDWEGILEKQTKALWAIKDELKKHVTTTELREMLDTNEQDSTGSEFDLRDRCADGMMFGPLGLCPICSGFLHYSGGHYRCHGYVSAWSKCFYSTTEPIRLEKKWKVPKDATNEYLSKWFKLQKGKKPIRVLPPQTERKKSLGETTNSFESLENLKVAFYEMPKETLESWKKKIHGIGGVIHAKVQKDTSCLVVSGELDIDDMEIKKSRRMKVPVVREDYLVDCFKNRKKLPFDQYKIEIVIGNLNVGLVTVKVKGRSSVHESSGLQDSGHILEDGQSIYNTTLNMSDLSTGINSYYILQIIQDDKSSDCYVFRKWGRVGSNQIGGSKLEEMTKSDAILEFKRLFHEKTGNPWEAWLQKTDFRKQPGRFFPLDIDYGVNEEISQKKSKNDERSQLPHRLIELMKMLFDVETYRAAMMEFQINVSEIPLGKLSKNNIQKGFEVLTEIQNLSSNSDKHELSVKESLIIDASNRFFTLIPSIHPHVIRDENDFREKIKMLEALQDIEIASKLVGFDAENDESLDQKYKKLHCQMSPLPHDSDDYRLVEKYLTATHAPTHKDWTIELEDVFSLEREGESDNYAPYRDKLQNKMLLWHGSRLTNFVGILNQGLRIAPPEAPTTGYMFGKGIYFADLVSKSAQYCYTDKSSPVGLLLLSEVALGEVYELKKASYMEKPPKGKHSTKGLGKKVPEESEHVNWRNGVNVPCGKPVSSGVRSTELMYNEYIVYNTAQVKMQFLVKVRFHHKR